MTHEEKVEAGKLIAQSEMFGKINPASGYMIASICESERMSYLKFSETYNWMHGGPSIKADVMLANFVEMGGDFEIVKRDSEEARIRVVWRGKTTEFGITWEEVSHEPFTKTREGGVKSNYATPRKRMQSLWSRVVSDSVHSVCPMASKGLYTPEEAETFDDEPDAPERREPVRISPEVAAARMAHRGEPGRVAGVVDADVQPEDAEVIEDAGEGSGTDYTVCPEGFGELSGVAWADMDDKTLTDALESGADEITPTYIAAIRYEIQRRAEMPKEEGGEA